MGTTTLMNSQLTTLKHQTSEIAAARALVIGNVIDNVWSTKAIANPAFGGCDAMYRFRPEETPPL